jgi:hypothetical protein
VAHKAVRRWVNLTGTPSPNGVQDLWGQAWFVDAGQRLDGAAARIKGDQDFGDGHGDAPVEFFYRDRRLALF